MSDNFNEAAETAAEAEARKRAERIAAIRRSVHNSPDNAEIAANNALSAAEKAVTGGTSPSAEMSWEDELAARISRRKETVRQNRAASAESILRELDSEPAPVETAEDIVNELSGPAEAPRQMTAEEIIQELLGYARKEPETVETSEPVYESEAADYGVYEPETAETAEPVYESESADYGVYEPETAETSEPVYESETADYGVYEPETAETSEPVAETPQEETVTEEKAPEPVAAPVRAPKPLRKLTRLDGRPAAAVSAPVPAVKTAEETVPPAETAAPAPVKAGKKKKKKKKTFKEKVLGFFPQKNDSILERIRKVLFLAAIAVIIVCGYIVGDYYLDLWRSKRENEKNMNTYWSVMEDEDRPDDDVPDDRRIYKLLSGAKKLLEENSEVVGVIRIEGTPVNNPVMQADDNSKYLNRKLSGRESRAGELFLDYRNHFDEVGEDGHLLYENSDNLVIYGHNMKDETMFGSLKYYDWYDTYYGEHPVIDLNSNYEQYKYKIFSIFILDAEDESDTKFDCWNKLDFSSEEEYYEFVNEAKRRTLRVNDVDVKYGDKLLTLSTCNTVLGQRGRLIVLARLVRDGEDPMAGTQNSTRNTNIKWPNLYYDYKGIRNTYDPEAEFVPYGPSEDKKQEVSGDKK